MLFEYIDNISYNASFSFFNIKGQLFSSSKVILRKDSKILFLFFLLSIIFLFCLLALKGFSIFLEFNSIFSGKYNIKYSYYNIYKIYFNKN